MSLSGRPWAFTPAEVGVITGVSPALQKEWRRQKILPSRQPGQQTLWLLKEVTWLFLLRLLSEAGITLSAARAVATDQLPVLMSFIAEEAARDPDLVAGHQVFEFKLSDRAIDERPNYLSEVIPIETADFLHLKVAHPRFSIIDRQSHGSICHPSSLVRMESLDDIPERFFVWTAIDHLRTAQQLIRTAHRCLLAREEAR